VYLLALLLVALRGSDNFTHCLAAVYLQAARLLLSAICGAAVH